jgi:hypothetical protein
MIKTSLFDLFCVIIISISLIITTITPRVMRHEAFILEGNLNTKEALDDAL